MSHGTIPVLYKEAELARKDFYKQLKRQFKDDWVYMEHEHDLHDETTRIYKQLHSSAVRKWNQASKPK